MCCAKKWTARIDQLWLYVAAIALFAMMFITVFDVVIRYVWNSPLGWSQEVITLYLLAAAFFMALSATLEDNAHIRIDFIGQYVSERTKTAMAILAYLAAFIFRSEEHTSELQSLMSISYAVFYLQNKTKI